MAIRSEVLVEVRYYETDLMGIVHHSNYIRYFECGRHQMLLDMDLPIVEIERRGYMLPVVSVECHYKTPARMGDTLRIVSQVNEEPKAKIKIENAIYNASTGELVCEGEVILGFIHSDTRKPSRAPEFFLETFRKYNK